MKNNIPYNQNVHQLHLLEKANGTLYKIPSASPCLMLMFVRSGSLLVEVDGIFYPMESAQLLIVSLRKLYRLEKPDEPVKCFCLVLPYTMGYSGFKRLFFLRLLHRNTATGIPLPLEDYDKKLLTQIFKLIKKENVISNGFVLTVLEFLLLAVHRLYLRNGLTDNQQHNRREQLAYTFLELAGKWCTSEHSVRFYALKLFVTPAHLNKTVKTVMGLSAKSCLTHYIIAEAKMLLDDSSQQIAAISDLLHFSHPAVFSRFFTKQTRMTPTYYRKYHQTV